MTAGRETQKAGTVEALLREVERELIGLQLLAHLQATDTVATQDSPPPRALGKDNG